MLWMLKRNRDIKIHEANGLELTFAVAGSSAVPVGEAKSQSWQAAAEAGSFPHKGGKKELVRREPRRAKEEGVWGGERWKVKS